MEPLKQFVLLEPAIAVNGTKVLLATQRRQRWSSVEAWREFVEFLTVNGDQLYEFTTLVFKVAS
jgi:hypothetical protein